MDNRKILMISIVLILGGFLLTGFVLGEGRPAAFSGNSQEMAVLMAEHRELKEKVAALEAALSQASPATPSTPQPAPGTEPGPTGETPAPAKILVAYVKEEHTAINARADAGTSFPVVERVQPKSPMVILETKDDWYRVRLESGNIAWVANWVVRVQEE